MSPGVSGGQDQASKHRAATQVQHCFLDLTLEMVVEAIRAHHSHDPCLEGVLGFSHSLLGQPLTFRNM